ncbi:MAG: aminoglycoside phosphotransferase family protein [Gammaproteobacteria bacterium]
MSGPLLGHDVASADASFRRYFRLQSRRGTLIAMDSPPDLYPLEGFVDVARRLRKVGVHAPTVHAADLAEGFALLSDLGQTTYLQALVADDRQADRLYGDAIHVLVTMQVKLATDGLPAYDDALLRTELNIFREWLLKRHLKIELSGDDLAGWTSTVDALVASALAQPQVFVHRDYHSRNLMVGAPGEPGVLDFQDAVRGPLTYDLVSLLRDCYVRWSPEQIQRWSGWYLDLARQTTLAERLPDDDGFRRAFDLMGAQRHLKAAGIFARLLHRDSKPGYLDDIPRTLGYVVEVAGSQAELGWLADLLTQRVLPALDAL